MACIGFISLFFLGVNPTDGSAQTHQHQEDRALQVTQTPTDTSISAEELVPYKGKTELRSLLLGGFYGIMMVMILYNLFIYFSLRDSVYLLYVGSATFALLTTIATNEMGEQYFWPKFEGADANLYIIFGGISMAFSSRFAAQFLNIKALSKRLNSVLWGIAGLSILMSLLCSFLGLDPIYHFARWLVLLSFPSLIAIGVYAYRKGNPLALFFVIAWVPYILGIIIRVIHGAGVLPTNFFTMSSIEIGGALEVTLLSLALADRIKKLRLELARKEMEEGQLRSLILEEQKDILQLKVDERTAELQQANATKNLFFSIVAHDLRSPLVALKGIGKQLHYLITKNKTQKLLQLGGKIDHSIEHLNHLLNNLLQWARSEKGEIPFHQEMIDFKALILQQLDLYEDTAQRKALRWKLSFQDVQVFADENSLATVIRNVLSNAIKFSPQGALIQVQLSSNHEGAVFTLIDEGEGIEGNLSNYDFKSKVGTQGERGFGLGLQLCREFVALNNGQFLIGNHQSGGTEVEIIFPFHTQNVEQKNK